MVRIVGGRQSRELLGVRHPVEVAGVHDRAAHARAMPDCSEEELEAAFQPNTKAVFGESIANPALIVLDFEKFAEGRSRSRRRCGRLRCRC